MEDGRYTVAEIDAMREIVSGMMPSGSYSSGQFERTVEDRLRTYMTNGTTLNELKIAAEARFEERAKRQIDELAFYNRSRVRGIPAA